MSQIGTVIRHYRETNNMSREQLSEGICTAKYLYLIEKGDRTPSNSILARLGERMNMSLFEYYNYLECENPVEVRRIMAGFLLSRRTFNLKKLMEYQDLAQCVQDFQTIPWKYETAFNHGMFKLMLDKKPLAAAKEIQNTLSEMPLEYRHSLHRLRHLILLSICHLESGDDKEANRTIGQVMEFFSGKVEGIEFQQMYFLCACIFMMVKIKTGNAAEAVALADEVLYHQNEKNYHDLQHFGLLLKGAALLKLGNLKEAHQPVCEGLMLFLVYDKPRDFAYLDHIGIMQEILQSGVVDAWLKKAIQDKYHG